MSIQALQRTAATELVCQGVEFQWLPRPLSLGVSGKPPLRYRRDKPGRSMICVF